MPHRQLFHVVGHRLQIPRHTLALPIQANQTNHQKDGNTKNPMLTIRHIFRHGLSLTGPLSFAMSQQTDSPVH